MLDLANKNQVVISTLHETVSSGTFNARMERYRYLLKYDIYRPYFWNTSEIFWEFCNFQKSKNTRLFGTYWILEKWANFKQKSLPFPGEIPL